MIAYLRGVVLRRIGEVVLDVNGVGYLVEVPASTLHSIPPVGEEAALHVHTLVREDAIRLFGFATAEAHALFERLLTVSGVGPKLALAALGQMTPTALQRAIVTADITKLRAISGVGKRTAERMVVDLGPSLKVLDLGESMDSGPGAGAGKTPVTEQLEEALRYLGYKEAAINDVVRSLAVKAEPDASVEELLKHALKLLK